MKKFIITILFAFFTLTKVVFASDFNINGKNIVLYNLNEDEVVYSKNYGYKNVLRKNDIIKKIPVKYGRQK